MIFHGTFRMRVPLEDRAPGVVAQVGSVRRCVRQTARCGQGRGRGRTELSICRRSLGRWALNQLWSATLNHEELTWINQPTWINILFNHQLTNILTINWPTNMLLFFIFLGDCMPILWDGHQIHCKKDSQSGMKDQQRGHAVAMTSLGYTEIFPWFVYVLGSHDISPMDGAWDM